MTTAMTRRHWLQAIGCLPLAATANAQRGDPPPRWIYDISDFADRRSQGWLPGFADYTIETAATNRLAEIRPLPAEVDNTRNGFYLRGRNTSDDLFMFLKKPVTRLSPGASYDVSFYLEVASQAPTGCVGIGGAPGESVWLKAGAATREPLATLANGGDIRFSLDKGNQAAGGPDAPIVSTIANGLPCESAGGRFVLLRRTVNLTRPVQADLSGTAWIFLGTDSGFEGTTEIYYAYIAALFTIRG